MAQARLQLITAQLEDFKNKSGIDTLEKKQKYEKELLDLHKQVETLASKSSIEALEFNTLKKEVTTKMPASYSAWKTAVLAIKQNAHDSAAELERIKQLLKTTQMEVSDKNTCTNIIAGFEKNLAVIKEIKEKGTETHLEQAMKNTAVLLKQIALKLPTYNKGNIQHTLQGKATVAAKQPASDLPAQVPSRASAFN